MASAFSDDDFDFAAELLVIPFDHLSLVVEPRIQTTANMKQGRSDRDLL